MNLQPKTWLESKENSANDDLGKKEVTSRGHLPRVDKHSRGHILTDSVRLHKVFELLKTGGSFGYIMNVYANDY